mgnify:CR=1 FL=1
MRLLPWRRPRRTSPTSTRLPRDEVDAYALTSQLRAKEAWTSGAFKDEVVPVMIRNRKTRQDEPWTADEHMRPDTTAEGLRLAAALLPRERRCGDGGKCFRDLRRRRRGGDRGRGDCRV